MTASSRKLRDSQKLRDFLRKAAYLEIEFYDPEACEPNPMEPLPADDWQRFSRDFVKEFGGQQVHNTGMTHREFLDYMDTGHRAGDLKYNETYDLEIYMGQGHWQAWKGQETG